MMEYYQRNEVRSPRGVKRGPIMTMCSVCSVFVCLDLNIWRESFLFIN